MSKSSVSELDRHIGLRIKQLRTQYGLSAESVAKNLDASQQQLSRYENGQNKISASQLFRIARSFDLPISWFFEGCLPLEEIRVLDVVRGHNQDELLKEQLALVSRLWSSISPEQRRAVLSLIDTF